jgi:hypothetical protein
MPLDGMNQIDLSRAGRLSPGLSRRPTPQMPATVLQLAAEAPIDVCRGLLPPALHPLNPGVLVITAYEVTATAERASFRTVEVGIQCRAGARARRYVLGAAIDDPRVAADMEARWGYVSTVADIKLERRYERIDLTVEAGHTVLRASLLGPEPVTPSAVLYVAGLRPVVFQDHPWIAQFERAFEISRADRGRPAVSEFDSRWWTGGQTAGLSATEPISGSFTRADVTLNPTRFLIAPGRSRAADTRRLADVVG